MYFSYLRGSSGASTCLNNPVAVKPSKSSSEKRKGKLGNVGNWNDPERSQERNRMTFVRIFTLAETIHFIFSLNKSLANSCEYMNAGKPHKYGLFRHLLLFQIVIQFQSRKSCHFTGTVYTIHPVLSSPELSEILAL